MVVSTAYPPKLYESFPAFEVDEIDYFKSRSLNILNDLSGQYSISLADISNHITGATTLGRLFSVLFFDESIFNIIDPRIRSVIATRVGISSDSIMMCPLYSMRVYLGGAFMSEQHENSFLQTEPHFDNGFGINGVSAWIPFHKVTENTGGLCYFNDDTGFKLGADKRNKLNFMRYYDNHSEYDNELKKSLEFLPVEKGECILHSKTLHGATKTTTERSSFNLRYVSSHDLELLADVSLKNMYKLYNNSFAKARAIHRDSILNYIDNLVDTKFSLPDALKSTIHYTQEMEGFKKW